MQNVWYCVLENTSAFSDSFSLGGGGVVEKQSYLKDWMWLNIQDIKMYIS